MAKNLLLYVQCDRHDMPLIRCGCNQYEEAVDPFFYSSEPVKSSKLVNECPETNERDTDRPSV